MAASSPSLEMLETGYSLSPIKQQLPKLGLGRKFECFKDSKVKPTSTNYKTMPHALINYE